MTTEGPTDPTAHAPRCERLGWTYDAPWRAGAPTIGRCKGCGALRRVVTGERTSK